MPFTKGRPPTAVEFDELLSHMTPELPGRRCLGGIEPHAQHRHELSAGAVLRGLGNRPALRNIQQSRAFVIASVTSHCPWFDYRGKSPGLLA